MILGKWSDIRQHPPMTQDSLPVTFSVVIWRKLLWMIAPNPFRMCKGIASQKNHTRPLHLSTPPLPSAGVVSRPPELAFLWYVASAGKQGAKKSNRRRSTTPFFVEEFSWYETHNWNHHSKPHPVIYISIQRTMATWYPFLVSFRHPSDRQFPVLPIDYEPEGNHSSPLLLGKRDFHVHIHQNFFTTTPKWMNMLLVVSSFIVEAIQ